jgi:hypothetical protein
MRSMTASAALSERGYSAPPPGMTSAGPRRSGDAEVGRQNISTAGLDTGRAPRKT